MSVASKTRTIDELAQKAARALARERAFEAERMALRGLNLAREEGEFERMEKLVPTLRDARRHRLDAAFSAGRMAVVDTPFTEEIEIEPGCYLVRPPLVGADARRLRLLALSRDIPVAVLCREPLARIGLCPIVAICGGFTVRTKVDPPVDDDHPGPDWFLDAMDALGEATMETIDPEMEVSRRIDAILTRLDAVPEYDGLHDCLQEVCREAHEAAQAERRDPPATKART